MALITCPECKRDISDKAAACPHCGAPRDAAPDSPAERARSAQTSGKSGGKAMGWFAKLALGVAGLFVVLLYFGARMSKEEAAAYSHRDAVEAECKKMMSDAALGAQRQLTRQLCDEMQRKAQLDLDRARARK
jgi:uncharacterized membrane protein YvbJ